MICSKQISMHMQVLTTLMSRLKMALYLKLAQVLSGAISPSKQVKAHGSV